MGRSVGTGVVGRREELATVGALVAGLVAGRGSVAWLEGEPGIGKSALVDAVMADARTAGGTVWRAAGDELMLEFPLRLMADCLGVSARSTDPAEVEIARLLGAAPAGSGVVDQISVAAERMLDLVTRRCMAGPTVVVLEDLHWADEPSLALWDRLARSAGRFPLLLVGTCRPVPFRATVGRLRELAQVLLRLGPLTGPETVELAAELVGVPGPRLWEQLSGAGGNPWYVTKFLDALAGTGMLVAEDGQAELPADPTALPVRLTASIARRLSFLSQPALRALRAAALLGTEFERADWELVSGVDAVRLAGVTAELLAAGALRAAGPRLAFRHDLVRQALMEQTPTVMRIGWHADIARTLMAAGRGVPTVARHLREVPDALPGWAVEWLAGLPEPATYGAPRECAELLARAVTDLPDDHPASAALADRLIQVQYRLGRDKLADRTAREVLSRTTDVETAAHMRWQLAHSARRAGQLEAALAIATEAPDDRPPAPWPARLAAAAAMSLADLGRTGAARTRALDALGQAHQCGDPLARTCALHVLARLAGEAARLAHLDQMLAALGDDPRSVEMRAQLVSERLAVLARSRGRDEVAAALREALALVGGAGTYASASVFATAAGVCYYHGRWDEALQHVRGLGRDLLDRGPFAGLHGIVAAIAWRREDRDLADAHLRAAGVADPARVPEPSTLPYSMAVALAIRAEANGQLGQALALRATWLDAPAREDGCYHELAHLVRLALDLGDPETAERAAAACTPFPEPTAERLTAARCCRALLDDDVDELLAVAEEYRTLGWSVHLAFALEEAAVQLARAGDTDRARGAYLDAVGIYADLRAGWDTRRADARLRSHGIRRGPRSRHRRAATGWAALTPGELRIVQLVAQGMATPDIAAELYLSGRTVQAHVSSVLKKLRLRSRAELAREAAQHSAQYTAG